MENSIKQWKWLVVLLAVLNIALLATMFFKPSPPPPPPMLIMEGPGGHPQGPADIIIRELKLTPEQVSKFEELKNEHQKAIRDLRESGKKLHDEFFDLLKNESATEAEIKSKAGAIGDNQEAIDVVTFNHFKALRAICTPEQKVRFDSIIKEILHKMAGPHGPRPGGPSDGPPHGPDGPQPPQP